MILFGNHCFLLLSTPFEVNILVIIGEIRVIALTKENMNKCNKYSKKKRVEIKAGYYCLNIAGFFSLTNSI